MAGHSKWKQIKRKKAVTDARRGANWTKIIKEITMAAKNGGGDPGGNPRLRLAISDAKAANMPAENIERAIKKGTGELEGVNYEDVTYEGYGPGGAAILVQTTTDNPTRTVADLRNIFGKGGGNLGTAGSVAWMFDKRGLISIEASRYEEDVAMEAALDAGAVDFVREGDSFVVSTEVAGFHAVQE
ncbi:MAG TPA: YebC/PmpR family DNA-binding transcriptional regulator, partial [Gemmatimonadales bacterium]